MAFFAVIGASGQTGTAVVRAVLSRTGACRVVGRDVEKLKRVFASTPGVECYQWVPADAQSLNAALTGIDTVIYLVSVPYNRFNLHPVYMDLTVQAAIRAGVRRMVLLSPVYSYGVPQTPIVTESHPRLPSTVKGKFRKAQEDVVLTAHARGQIEGTVVHVADFFGPNCPLSTVNDVFVAAKAGRRANILGPINTPHQFAFVPDVGEVLVRVALEQRSYGRSWNFAGSGTISQEILGKEAFRQAGSRPRFFPIGKTMLRTMGFVDPVMRELVEMRYLQQTPVILGDDELRGLIGDFNVTPYDEAVRQTLVAC